MNAPVVFNIQHFSLHDGPGIRTTVFLKGCNLRCAWCHNPESFVARPVLRFSAEKCIGCGRCVAVCSRGAHAIDARSLHTLDRSRCVCDGACADVCNARALELCGREMHPREIVEEVMRDKRLYEISGGGVTFSGGEPLLQAEALAAVAGPLHAQGIHVAVDTACCVPFERVRISLACTDLFLVDVKLFDDERHRRYTGSSNRIILENIPRLACEKPLVIRVPVIAGVNDDEAEMERIARFVGGIGGGLRNVELLGYHRLGASKYATLGLEARLFEAPSPDRMERLAQLFERHGVIARIS